jgi:hypothetical protein
MKLIHIKNKKIEFDSIPSEMIWDHFLNRFFNITMKIASQNILKTGLRPTPKSGYKHPKFLRLTKSGKNL